MRKAYRLWLCTEDHVCDGFYEIRSLEELFSMIATFKEYNGYKGYRSYARVEETTIDTDCSICSIKETDVSYTIDLGYIRGK